MNYKKEDKEYIEKSGRYAYYDFTEKGVERIVGTNVENVSSYDWKRLIQMIYPTNMIGSGLFQPILIFRIGKNGKRIDPPIEAYDSLDDIKNGTCLFFKIIEHIEKNSNVEIDYSWYEEDKAKKYCKELNKNMLYKANNIKFSLEEVVRC